MASLDSLYASSDPALNLLWRTASIVRSERGTLLSDALGGALLDAEAGVPLTANALYRVKARIADLDNLDQKMMAAVRHAARDLGELVHLPDPVREVAFQAIDRGGRWHTPSRGLRQLVLPVDSPCQVELLRIEPGCGVPRHDHTGSEYTLVLTGAFHDGHALYRPGDISLGEPGLTHQPVASSGEVCFALAVSEGDVRFEGVLGLLQKLTRH